MRDTLDRLAGTNCTCGHDGSDHVVQFGQRIPCRWCDCVDFTPRLNPPKPTPRPKPAAPTFSPPDHIARDVRKFALSQAVKALGGITPGMKIVDIAAEFEDYVMNGKKDK